MKKHGKGKKQKRRDKGGAGSNGSFLGSIRIMNRPPNWKKGGRLVRPKSGAELTIRQTLPGISFAVGTGLAGGTSSLPMVAVTGFALAFGHTLADLPQASSWTAVFDQYRFEEIEIHLYPFSSEIVQQTALKDVPSPSQFVLDFDDTSALASENAALEYDNVQTAMPYDAVQIRYKPAVAPAYYQSGAFSGYGVEPSDLNWLDCGSPSIRHYGVKGWVGAFGATSSAVGGWLVYGQYTVSFRNVH